MKIFIALVLTPFFFAACATTPSGLNKAECGPLLAKYCLSEKLTTEIHRQLSCIGGEETDGLKSGLWCCFDSQKHLLMASQFAKGLKNGRTELYSSADGHLETISSWVDGKLEGRQLNFNHNGTVANEYSLHENRFDGEMRDYDQDGNLEALHHYQNGICLDPDRIVNESN